MKRMGLFLAVFSIGLVLFMVLTGQLEEQFRPKDESVATPKRDKLPNTFVYRGPDIEFNRDRFILSGVLDPGTSLRIVAETKFNKEIVLTDAELELPIYSQQKPIERTGSFRLRSKRVKFDQQKIDMTEKIVGESSDGLSFETNNIEVDFIDPSENHPNGAQLTSTSPIALRDSTLELFGENGFTGIVDDENKLKYIEINPPIVVAVMTSRGGGFLGLPESSDNSNDSGRIIVICEGPLRIYRGSALQKGTAQFDGPVSIFRDNQDTPLHPKPAIPVTHVRCSQLVLKLGGTPVGVTHAMATRGENEQLRGTFLHVQDAKTEKYEIYGDKIEWAAELKNAIFTGENGIKVVGPLGEFTAKYAKYTPETQVCELLENVVAHVQSDQLGAPQKLTIQSGPSSWKLFSDGAALSFKQNSPAVDTGRSTRLTFFKAWSKEPGELRVIEQADGGARLVGSHLNYNPQSNILTVLPSTDGTAQPSFEKAKSHAKANEITLQLGEKQTLQLKGEVNALLFDNSEFELSKGSNWPSDSHPEDHFIIRCDSLELSWNSVTQNKSKKHEFQSIRASSHQQTLASLLFNSFDPERMCSIEGGEIFWDRALKELTVTGNGRQRLSLGEDAVVLTANEIHYSMVLSMAKAIGQVHVIAEKSIFLNDSSKMLQAGSNAIELEAPKLALWIDPKAKNENPNDDNSKTASDKLLKGRIALLQRVEAVSKEGQDLVRLTDGAMLAIGQKLVLDLVTGLLKLDGDTRQRVEYLTPEGMSFLEGQHLQLQKEQDHYVVNITGEVRCQIRQGLASQFTSSASRNSTSKNSAGQDRQLWILSAKTLHGTLGSRETDQSDGLTRTIELIEFSAHDDLRIENSDQELTFVGDSCVWLERTQILRLFAPKGEGLQTLYRGPEGENKRDEIVAREISIIRQDSRPDELKVFFEEVIQATIHPPMRPPSGRSQLDYNFQSKIRVRTDNLMVRLNKAKETGNQDKGSTAQQIQEANAWGSVIINADKLQALCESAVYNSRNTSIWLYGKPGNPPQISGDGTRSSWLGDADPIVIRKGRRRLEIDVPGGPRKRLDKANIRSILKLINKEERAPK